MVDLLQDAAVDVHEAQAEQRLVVVRGGAHLAVHRQQRRLLVVGRRAPEQQDCVFICITSFQMA